MQSPSRPILFKNGAVSRDWPAGLGFSSITDARWGSSPRAIAGRLSVSRLINSRWTGAKGTGRLSREAAKTTRIPPKFPDSRN